MHNQQGFDKITSHLRDKKVISKEEIEERNKWERIDNLIHKLFKQSDEGSELLSIWKESLIMSPTVTANSTQFQAGISEGKKEFIRNILLTIKKVENNV